MVAPSALPMASAEGAVHPRALNDALPLPETLEPELAELELVAAEDLLALLLTVVFELLEPPPLLQAASTITTTPPKTNRATLVPMPSQITPYGRLAQRNSTSPTALARRERAVRRARFCRRRRPHGGVRPRCHRRPSRTPRPKR
jgi:hypothetical protein